MQNVDARHNQAAPSTQYGAVGQAGMFQPAARQAKCMTRPPLSRYLLRTLLLFLPIALLIGTGAYFIHQTEQRRQQEVDAEHGREAVLIWTVTINNTLQAVSRDVMFLADHYQNHDISGQPTQSQLDALAVDWISFSQVKQVYDQIRWIDQDGNDRLRVRYAQPRPEVVSLEPQENASMREYFADVSKLAAGETYVATLDEEKPNSQPDKAYKTRICFATPVFDLGGKRRGIVMLTYSAADLLERLGPMLATDGKLTWVVNHDGYWLKGTEAANEWGFVPESGKLNMRDRYPAVWQQILQSRRGQFFTPEGLWSFDTVYPMQEGEKASAATHPEADADHNDLAKSEYLWKTVSLLPAAEYRSSMLPFDTKLGGSALILLTLFLIGSWKIARAQLDEQAVRRNLETMVEKRNHDLAESRRLENALQESELFARATIDALSAELCVLDQNGTIVAVNQAWKRFYDENSPNPQHYPNYGLGINYLEVCDRARGPFSEEAASMAAGIRAVISGERDWFALEYPCPSPSEQRWFRVGVTRFQGAAHQVVLTHENITERKKAEAELQLSATVYRAIGEAIVVADRKNIIVAVNPAFSELTGYSEAEVIGRSTKILTSSRNGKNFYRNMWHVLEKTSNWQGKIWTRHKDDSESLDWLRINTIHDEHGAVQQMIGMYSTITDQKLAEQALWEQANFDTLTGLPNRSMFYDRLEQEIKKAHRVALPLALMFIDLDHFKDVNDTLGHDMGDLLLKDVAQHLRHCVRETDIVARLGGDEFTVILSALDDPGTIERVANSILHHLAQPFQLGLETVYISASIGITLFPNDASEINALLKNADQAMYAAKNFGRNQFHYFTQSMQESALRRMRLANDLRGALAGNQFQVVYQPIVDLSTGFIRKAEALVRWQHPTRGQVSPSEFIPIAEETGLINSIGDWVFDQASQQSEHWRQLYHGQFQISVNMSPVQFRKAIVSHDGSIDKLQNHSPHPHSDGAIVVEITEGVLLDASTAVADQLLMFRDAGIQVSLDDFGTGYSSLSYLKKFHIDYLKIDQSFVLKLEADSDDKSLCEAIVVMAHKLGLKVIAEGIETQRQRQLLAAAGCDFGQGYLFSKAVSADEFEALLKTGFAI
jgi:diguanylate cyclase (GGDEF)-like protein/PAS domain S-box-containing protein